MSCRNCGKSTDNPKFCSRSCAAIATNKATPKRKPSGRCADCSEPLPTSRKRCRACNEKRSPRNKTIGELRAKERKRKRHTSWLHHEVRALNRAWNRELAQQPCRRCGYALHVELAHRVAITEFPDDALLTEINAPPNIIPLCPNCHWELDTGLLHASKDFESCPRREAETRFPERQDLNLLPSD